MSDFEYGGALIRAILATILATIVAYIGIVSSILKLVANHEMTQAELAEEVGVTRQTIITIEQGRYSPSLEMAFKIARAFGVPLGQVFQYPDSNK